MQPIQHTVTPNPFLGTRRKLAGLAALGLALSLALPAHAADSAKSKRKTQRVLALKATKRLAAPAKLAGPPNRLLLQGPALLRLEITDREGSHSKRIQLELLISNERTANLETRIDSDEYELSVSPASTAGMLRVHVRRRGNESFQIATLVDPKRPALLSRVGNGSNLTEIRLLGIRALPQAKAPETKTPQTKAPTR
ncbi:MAG: hypothetical protein H6718_29525 [Polyangiaceae bacterium]|nr:hypothetical protein [Polyangiaceae bacterium]